MNTIISSNYRYDKYLRNELFGTGQELTDSERDGHDIFFREFGHPDGGGDCFHCHGNKLFQEVNIDDQYRNNRLQAAAGINNFADPGRGKVTENPDDYGKFKVPFLRNWSYTAPYMHDGRFPTIEEVVEFYSTGL